MAKTVIPDRLLERIHRLKASLPVAPRGSKEAVLACFGRWAGDPEELDRLLAEVEKAREDDIAAAKKP